jgi:hypothetical protein
MSRVFEVLYDTFGNFNEGVRHNFRRQIYISLLLKTKDCELKGS